MQSIKNSPLVFIVANRIASKTSSIESVAVDPNDHDKVIENSVLLEFLKKPNQKQNNKSFFRDIYKTLAPSGNVFIYKQDTIGLENDFTLQIWTPAKVDIKTNDNGVIVGYKYTDAFSMEIEVGPDELDNVLHIHYSDVCQYEENGAYYGLSPVEAMWIIIKSSDEKFNADASIFQNRGIAGILTNDTDVPMLPKERQDTQDSFNADIGGSDRFNSIHVTNTRLRYLQTGMSPTDLKLLEGIISSLRLWCAAYGLPSQLFNDNESSTYNNVKEAKITAFQDCYLPTYELVSDELSPWLSRHLGVDEYLKPDLTKIDVLHDTTNKIMRNLNSLDPTVARVVSAALMVDDVREMLGADVMGNIDGQQMIGVSQQETNANNG